MRRTLAIITLIGFTSFIYLERGVLRDTYRSWQRGPIPTEITRTEVTTIPKPAVTPTVIARSPKDDDRSPDQLREAISNPPVITAKPVLPASPTIPTQFNLKLAFIPQAPLQVWDALHEDSCEEASMLMLAAYLQDITTYTPQESEDLIQKLIAAETAQGDGGSITAERVVELMKTELGIKTAKVVPLNSIDDLKKQLASGHPVILPAAGKFLKNPNFKNGGPFYHMLVAKGYTKSTIITNDPGTRHGENYAYDQEIIWTAIHDWNNGDVENGQKVMIIAE